MRRYIFFFTLCIVVVLTPYEVNAEAKPEFWQPLTAKDFYDLAQGKEVQILPFEQHPVAELERRFGTLDLGGTSNELQQACQIYLELANEIRSDQEELLSSTRTRIETLWGPNRSGETSLWWSPMIKAEPFLLGTVGTRLLQLARFNSYLRGFENTLCTEGKDAELEVASITSDAIGHAAVMMLHPLKDELFNPNDISQDRKLAAFANLARGDARVGSVLVVDPSDDPILSPDGGGYRDGAYFSSVKPTFPFTQNIGPKEAAAREFFSSWQFNFPPYFDYANEIDIAIGLAKRLSKNRSLSISISGLLGEKIQINLRRIKINHLIIHSSIIENLHVDDSNINILDISDLDIKEIFGLNIESQRIHLQRLTPRSLSTTASAGSINFSGAKIGALTVSGLKSLRVVNPNPDLKTAKAEYQVEFDFVLQKASLDSLEVSDSSLSSFYANEVTVTHKSRIRRTVFVHLFALESAQLHSIEFTELVGEEREYLPKYSNRQRLNLSNAQVKNHVDLIDVTLSELWIGRARAGRLNVNVSDISYIWAYQIEILTDVSLSNLTFKRKLSFFGTKGQNITLRNVVGDFSDGSANPNRASQIDFRELDVRGEVALYDALVGDFFVAKSRAKVLRVHNGEFKHINVWGAEFGLVFLRPNIVDKVAAWYLRAQGFEVGKPEKQDFTVNNSIDARFSNIDRLYIGHIQSNTVNWNGLNADRVWIQCTRIKEDIKFTASYIDDFYAHAADANVLGLVDASLNYIWIGREYKSSTEGEEPETPTTPTLSDTSSQIQVTNSSDANGRCRGANAPKGRIGILRLDGAQAHGTTIGTEVTDLIHAARLRTEYLVFFGDAAELGDNSVVSLRNSSVGIFSLPLGMFASENHNKALDLDGATIGKLRLFDERWDAFEIDRGSGKTAVLTEANNGLLMRNKQVPAGSNASKEEYRKLVFDELLPAVQRKAESDSVTYRGADYVFLRQSLEDVGYPSLAREVAVAQNNQYRAVLRSEGALGLYAVYWLGYWINDYGYDNGKALHWLFLIWIFGVLALLAERRLAAKRIDSDEKADPSLQLSPQNLRSVKTPIVSRRPPQQREAAHTRLSYGRKVIESLFLSADRTVPTLTIDENFNRPANHEGAVRRHSALIVFLYLQRFIAFVIVIFMIGGILDVFQ